MNQYTFDAEVVSDLYKNAHGFRPRAYFWDEWDSADDANKQRIWDNLIAYSAVVMEHEKRMQDLAIERTEKEIQVILSTVIGATRDDAVRFLCEMYNANDDLYHLEYELGIPYGYFSGQLI